VSAVKTEPFTHVAVTASPPTLTLALRAKLLPSTIRNAAWPEATLAGSTRLTAGGSAAFDPHAAEAASRHAASSGAIGARDGGRAMSRLYGRHGH
jgi:hypothetical protein